MVASVFCRYALQNVWGARDGIAFYNQALTLVDLRSAYVKHPEILSSSSENSKSFIDKYYKENKLVTYSDDLRGSFRFKGLVE